MAKSELKEVLKKESVKAPSRLEEMEQWFENVFRRPYSLPVSCGAEQRREDSRMQCLKD